jgi:hypothetical protein
MGQWKGSGGEIEDGEKNYKVLCTLYGLLWCCSSM